MAKTGAHLRVVQMGTSVMGVKLDGNPARPEPEYFRVVFPGGDVDLTRLDDGSYWVHIRVNRPQDIMGNEDGAKVGRLVDARLDIADMHANDTNVGDFGHPGLYHVAVRVKAD